MRVSVTRLLSGRGLAAGLVWVAAIGCVAPGRAAEVVLAAAAPAPMAEYAGVLVGSSGERPEAAVPSDTAPLPTATAPVAEVDSAPVRAPEVQIQAPKPIVELVEKMAPDFQLWPQLVLAIMQAESSFNPAAQSPKNAMGLMQLVPGTAERFNVKKPFDPKQNIRGGMAYLRWLLAYFEGDIALVAAGYNAGERRVDRYLGVPPYGETRAYVKRVLAALGSQQAHPYDASVTEPSAKLAQIRAEAESPGSVERSPRTAGRR